MAEGNLYDEKGPKVWPECGECKTPWVLRWAFMPFSEKGSGFVWQRDCRHKNAEVVTVEREAAA